MAGYGERDEHAGSREV